MATNHTQKYGLNLWEPGDAFLREEFNENTEKLESALKAKGNCTILHGTYVGTGEYGQDHPNVLDFSDTTGKAPVLVFIAVSGIYRFTAMQGMDHYETQLNSNTSTFIYRFGWTDTAFSWYINHSARVQMNLEGTVYHYCAVFD